MSTLDSDMAEAYDDTAAAASDPTFVGRSRELASFHEAFERMLGERRQIMALAGEPGIGKTRCAEAIALAAEERGALALWGRCYEEPGAPPYWPWVQIIREYVSASSPDEVRMMMGARADDLVSLLPDLAEGGEPHDAVAGDFTKASFARFRTFDAIARFFVKASAELPLLLVIDNIHWADAPSLSLLEFLAQELARSRVLILITYRDTEVLRKSPLAHTLGGFARGTEFVRIRLGGLDGEAIGGLARSTVGMELSQNALEAILDQTDGNPLFVMELLKVLVEESASGGVEPIAVQIPDGVREAIGRRLSRLTDRCNELLTAASVLGRHFGANELAGTADVPIEGVIANLDLAAEAGILEPDSDGVGYRFAHALIRETLYEEIPKLARLRLHGRAGDTLAALSGLRLGTDLSRIAHHYYEAAPIGYLDRAADIGLLAAEYASRIFAFEEAVAHYDQIISVLEVNGQSNDERAARACFHKAYTLLALGHVTEVVTTLLDAATRAHKLGNWLLLSDVVVHIVMASSYAPQHRYIPMLKKILGMLPEGESPARAKTLASLGFALRGTGDSARLHEVVDEAVEMARHLDDRAAKWMAFKMAMLALRGRPETLPRRLELTREYFSLADPHGDHDLVAWQLLNLFEAGRVHELNALLQRYSALTVTRFGLHEYYLEQARTTLLLLQGQWSGLEEKIERLREIGQKTRPLDAEGVYGAQMFALNRDLGRLGELKPIVRQFAKPGGPRAWTPALLVICAELGMLDEAREALGRFAQEGFLEAAGDDLYETRLVYCAEACWRLGDAERAANIYERLLPYAGLTANHPRAVCLGAADLYLGMTATLNGDLACARRHYEAALELNRAMEAWPWLARTRLRYGASLLSSKDPEDEKKARTLLRDAEQLAGRLDMRQVASEARHLLGGNDDERNGFPDDLTAREVDVLRLIAIGRSNKDISTVLSISLNTVATHVRNILTKTHCANRTEAAAYAMRSGLAPRP